MRRGVAPVALGLILILAGCTQGHPAVTQGTGATEPSPTASGAGTKFLPLTTSTTEALWPQAAGQWLPMSTSPLSERAGSAYAWTGSRLLIWGGFNIGTRQEQTLADGAAYDPAGNRWSSMAASPLSARDSPVSVWDGHELLVWGGRTGACCDEPADGAAYQPLTDRWTMLPAAPLPAKRPTEAEGTWTGRELLIWIGDPGVGAAYDPSTGRWRLLPPSPLTPRSGALVAWDGTGLVVVGGFLDRGAVGTSAVDGARYDPATGAWTPLQPMPHAPEASVVTPYGLIVLANTTDPNTSPVFLRLAPGAQSWQTLPRPPRAGPAIGDKPPILQARALLWSGTEVLVPGWYGFGLAPTGTGGASFDPATQRWRMLPGGGQPSGGNGAYAWTGSELIEWGGQGWSAGVTYNSGFRLRLTP